MRLDGPGVLTLQGELCLRDFGTFIDSLKNDEFVRVTDVRSDPVPRWPPLRWSRAVPVRS